jgi:hypothetical protein
MFTFIHAQIISKDGFNFQNKVLSWVKLHYPKAVCFDFDNWSGGDIVQYATQLLKEESNAIILIEKCTEEPTHGIATWVEKILKQHQSIKILILGDDKFLNILANKYPSQIWLVSDYVAWQATLKKLWNQK